MSLRPAKRSELSGELSKVLLSLGGRAYGSMILVPGAAMAHISQEEKMVSSLIYGKCTPIWTQTQKGKEEKLGFFWKGWMHKKMGSGRGIQLAMGLIITLLGRQPRKSVLRSTMLTAETSGREGV